MDNKVAVITGASRGIGREIALKLAKNNFNIVLAAKTLHEHATLPGSITEVAKEVEALGYKALPYQLDVRDEENIEAMVSVIKKTFGRIDVLVNNAGAIYLSSAEDTTAKQYDLMHDINARATFLMSHYCLPLLKQQGGHIVSLSPPVSLSKKWLSLHLAYTVSKFNMSLYTMGMAEEFKKYGIGVNSLWPKTLIYTAAIKRLMGQEAQKNCRKPAIMADAVHWIVSQDPKTLSGNCFIDEEIIKKSGQDLRSYACNPNEELAADIFVD